MMTVGKAAGGMRSTGKPLPITELTSTSAPGAAAQSCSAVPPAALMSSSTTPPLLASGGEAMAKKPALPSALSLAWRYCPGAVYPAARAEPMSSCRRWSPSASALLPASVAPLNCTSAPQLAHTRTSRSRRRLLRLL